MRWEDGVVAERWIAAQDRDGDLWRRQLIGPLVLRICRELADGGDPFGFSVFDALERSCLDEKEPSSGPVQVIDIGAGEGWLGSALGPLTRYLAFESSTKLVERARERILALGPGAEVHAVEIDQPNDDMMAVLSAALSRAPSATLVTGISLLERINDPAPLLRNLHQRLKRHPNTPVLFVTLDAEHFRDDLADKEAPFGTYTVGSSVYVRSIGAPVDGILRSRRAYEELFRDTGFFVRRLEPLHFGPNVCGHCSVCAPSSSPVVDSHGIPSEFERRDVLRSPPFWSWTVSARPGMDVMTEDGALARTASRLAEVSDRATMTYSLHPGEHIFRAGNIGGHLVEILHGDAKVVAQSRRGESHTAPPITLPSATVVGDLEATGEAGAQYFTNDVIADHTGCTIARLDTRSSATILDYDRELTGHLYRAMVDRLQLEVLKNGSVEPRRGWRAQCAPIPPKLSPHEQWKLARCLLWSATIERHVRARRFVSDVAFINMDAATTLFHPTTKTNDVFIECLRLFQTLRIVDAIPLHKVKDSKDKSVREAWLCEYTTLHHSIGVRFFGRRSDETLSAFGRAMARRHAESAGGGSGAPTASEIADEYFQQPRGAKVEQWENFVELVDRAWTSDQQSIAFVVLRDPAALRGIAFGSQADIEDLVLARARHLTPKETSGARPWEELLDDSSPKSLRSLLAVSRRFFEEAIRPWRDKKVWFSHELLTTLRPNVEAM